MILREALVLARERLRVSGSDESGIEAEVLLRHALGLDRATFLRVLNEPVSATENAACERVLSRRMAGEPAAYITGTREFRGLEFRVTPATLIPRPETELLVDAVIEAVKTRGSESPSLVDVGTGSGAIAVSLAKALPRASIYATDISAAALAVSCENALRHGVIDQISFRRGDLLEPLAAKVDVIAANLPYVRLADWRELPREIRDHEPRTALEAGEDGLDAIRALLRSAPPYLKPGGCVFLEFGAGQAAAIRSAAAPGFSSLEIREDFAGIPRLLIARLAPALASLARPVESE